MSRTLRPLLVDMLRYVRICDETPEDSPDYDADWKAKQAVIRRAERAIAKLPDEQHSDAASLREAFDAGKQAGYDWAVAIETDCGEFEIVEPTYEQWLTQRDGAQARRSEDA